MSKLLNWMAMLVNKDKQRFEKETKVNDVFYNELKLETMKKSFNKKRGGFQKNE